MKFSIKICAIFAVVGLTSSGILYFVGAITNVSYSLKTSDPLYFGVTYMSLNNDYFRVMNEQIELIVEGNGDILLAFDGGLSLEHQRQQVQYMIDHDFDVIFINPVEQTGLEDLLEECEEAGIVIIFLDTGSQSSEYISIVSDNSEAGKLIVQDVLSHFEEGNILLLTHEQTLSGSDRISAFKNEIQNHDNFEVVGELNSQGQLEVAMPLVMDYLSNHDSVDVIVALNDLAALGAVAALQSLGIEGVAVYGVDGSEEAKRLVAQGLMQGTVAQTPILMGDKAVELAYSLLLEQSIENRQIIMPVEMINSENIEMFSLDGWQ